MSGSALKAAVVASAVVSLVALAGADVAGADVRAELVEMPGPGFLPSYYELQITGDAASSDVVANAVPGTVTLTSSNDRVVAGTGCVQNGPGEAQCPSSFARVDLGPGDDTLTAHASINEPAIGFAISGGEGRDRLTLTGEGQIDGGPGHDVLVGGAGRQTLHGGGPGPSADRVSGGSGDVLDYSGRSTPVHIDLRRTRQGAGDVIHGLQSVQGGAGDDVLIGNERGNSLAGGHGDDRIFGRGGNDSLDGGSGRNQLFGGHGDDSLRLGPGDSGSAGAGDDTISGHSPAAIRCGPGRDLANFVDTLLPLLRQCEAFEALYGPIRAEGLAAAKPSVVMSCLQRMIACHGRVKVQIGHTSITRRFTNRPERHQRIRMPFKPSARQLVATGEAVTISWIIRRESYATGPDTSEILEGDQGTRVLRLRSRHPRRNH